MTVLAFTDHLKERMSSPTRPPKPVVEAVLRHGVNQFMPDGSVRRTLCGYCVVVDPSRGTVVTAYDTNQRGPRRSGPKRRARARARVEKYYGKAASW